MINQIKIKNKNIIPIQNCLPKYIQSGCYIFNKNNLEIGIAQNATIKNYISFYSNSFITNLRPMAFVDCSSLQSINLPNVTNIGDQAFQYCNSLQFVALPNVTNIGSYTFQGCSSLQSINLPNVISINYYAFDGCASLQQINLPNVTSIGEWAFGYCSSLQSINLPNVTNINQGAFGGCTSLQQINLPNVTSIGGYTFWNCTSLQSINLPKVTSINWSTFENCTSLSQIVFGTSQICVLNTSNAFNSTPFTLSSTSGGTLYVPQSLVTTYQSATNWAVVLAANPNNQVLPIEGSPFDPNNQE